MVKRFDIADAKGKTYHKEVEDDVVSGLMGLKIGQEFDGGILGLPGYKLLFTGGTDKDGVPMRKDIDGSARKKLLLSRGPGFKPPKAKPKGIRRRKLVRGNTLTEDIMQVNVKVVKAGQKKLEAILGKPAEKPAEAEAPAEEAKPEEKKEEAHKEEKQAEEKKEEKPAEAPAEEKKEEELAEEKKEKPTEEKKEEPAESK